MTLYSGQVLQVVHASGNASVASISITDSNATGASGDIGTIWAIGGVNLAGPPALDKQLLTGTLLNGATFSLRAEHFTANGFDFYLLPADRSADAVAHITTTVSAGNANPFAYLDRGLAPDAEALRTGQALTVRFDTQGHALGRGIGQVVVSDDDGVIEFASETGRGAQVLLGPNHGTHAFNATGLGQMTLVEVSYHAASGDSAFEALRYTLPASGGGSLVYYIPLAGSVNLHKVQSYLGETTLSTSAEGMHYSDFALGARLFGRTGTAAADFVQGSILPDDINGGSGNDTLIGGLAADKLSGGSGNDLAKGGTQDDTLLGGDGNDQLQGGNDADFLQGDTGDDRLSGDAGNDTGYGGLGNDNLNGGAGQDLLFGDDGNDNLNGDAGNDEIHDGPGQDVLTGGLGADHFVLEADGTKDRITDFQDGIDTISLGVAYADLTLTTLKDGRVQIEYGNDLLWVQDTDRHLTAADLTAADFI